MQQKAYGESRKTTRYIPTLIVCNLYTNISELGSVSNGGFGSYFSTNPTSKNPLNNHTSYLVEAGFLRKPTTTK